MSCSSSTSRATPSTACRYLIRVVSASSTSGPSRPRLARLRAVRSRSTASRMSLRSSMVAPTLGTSKIITGLPSRSTSVRMSMAVSESVNENSPGISARAPKQMTDMWSASEITAPAGRGSPGRSILAVVRGTLAPWVVAEPSEELPSTLRHQMERLLGTRRSARPAASGLTSTRAEDPRSPGRGAAQPDPKLRPGRETSAAPNLAMHLDLVTKLAANVRTMAKIPFPIPAGGGHP